MIFSALFLVFEYPDGTFSGGGGGVLPYKDLMGTCGQPGMFFGIFVLNRVSNLSFFVLIRVLLYQFLS